MRALAVPLGAVVLVGFYLLLVGIRSGESAHIDVTPLTVGFASAAGAAMASGVVALWALRRGAVGALFALAAAMLAFSFLALFSVGLLVLPFGLVVLVLAIRRLRRDAPPRDLRAAAGGLAIGIGAIAYLVVLIQPASAECREGGGGTTSSGGLFGPIARSQGGYSTVDGAQGGYIDEGDRIAYFSCEGAKMTDFHRESLPQGQWVVTTQPAATVGRTVLVVFRLRPLAGVEVAIPTDGFDFSATCRTCPEPRPVVRGHVVLTGARAPGAPGASVTFAGQVTFPAAGSWYTSPYDQGIEVR